MGVALAIRYSGRSDALVGSVLERGTVAARIGLVIWVAAVVAVRWAPYDFTLNRERVTTGVNQLLTAPLFHYFWAQEYQAFVQFLRAALLALPLGVLLYIAWPDGGRPFVPRLRWFVAIAGGFAILFAMELGLVLLPGRIPDITDVILGVIGVSVGLWLAGRIGRLRSPSMTGDVQMTGFRR